MDRNNQALLRVGDLQHSFFNTGLTQPSFENNQATATGAEIPVAAWDRLPDHLQRHSLEDSLEEPPPPYEATAGLPTYHDARTQGAMPEIPRFEELTHANIWDLLVQRSHEVFRVTLPLQDALLEIRDSLDPDDPYRDAIREMYGRLWDIQEEILELKDEAAVQMDIIIIERMVEGKEEFDQEGLTKARRALAGVYQQAAEGYLTGDSLFELWKSCREMHAVTASWPVGQDGLRHRPRS